MIEVLACDRQLRNPDWHGYPVPPQLTDPPHERVAPLRNLMYGQYNGHEQNETGQERE
jgi:hypothetical protein